MPSGHSAVVVGATGATGRRIVRALCASDTWTSVIAVTRREPRAGELYDGTKPEKLTVQANVTLDDAAHEEGCVKAWTGAGVLFNALGTTRGAAGSANEFKRIEVTLSARAAQIARKAGISSACVVSAQGANANQGVPWEKLHPLLYVQTIGRKEVVMREAFNKADGGQLAIFRPGMLNRQMGGMMQGFQDKTGFGIKVETLAAAMVAVGEGLAASAGSPKDEATYEGNGRIAAVAAGGGSS